ncbi:MAG TPA: MATE family efflux transporter [Rectinemataceae bacterium]|nr:MATE family efflux transporter [Rectinemataceae bacterium]
MTEGNEARLIVAFSIPLLLGNVFQQLYSTVDAMVVGIGVSKEALAAIGVSLPLICLTISVIMGVSMGGSVVMSQYFGAREPVHLRAAMHTIYAFLLVASVITSVLGIALADPILVFIGTPAAYLDQARVFLQITFSGMVFVFGYNAISSVLRSLGDSRNPLYFLVFASLLNIGLVLLFVLVLGWGVAGSAWATFFAQAAAFAASLVFVQRSKDELLHISLRELRIDPEELRRILRVGLPTALQMGLVALSFVALSAIVNPFGTDVMAGYAAASRLDSFAVLPSMNLSIAMSIFVGQNMGARRPERVRRALRATLVLSTALSLVISALFLLIPDSLNRLFATDPAVVAHGARYLVIVASFYPLFSAMFVLSGLLRGAGAATFAMASAVVAVWAARIPASFVLSRIYGADGIWIGIPVGWVIGLGMVAVKYLGGSWKDYRVIGDEAAEGLVAEAGELAVASEGKDLPCGYGLAEC